MKEINLNEFERLLIAGKNPLGTSVLFLLSWIAASDGHLDDTELERLHTIAESTNHLNDLSSILQLASKRDLEAIQLACEIIQKCYTGDQALLFIQMAIGIAAADGYLTLSENYIVRFLVDVVGLSNHSLNQAYLSVTSRPIPNKSDPSSADWWNSRRNSQPHSEKEKGKPAEEYPNKMLFERLKALAMLGLDEEASLNDIKSAYRRMAKIHHPDRFECLGEEAVAAASQTFKRIQNAYNYLISNA